MFYPHFQPKRDVYQLPAKIFPKNNRLDYQISFVELVFGILLMAANISWNIL